MTLIWLIVWLCSSTPHLHQWNSWAVWLLICAAGDLCGGGRAAS